MTTMSLIPNRFGNQPVVDWKQLATFHAETTLSEKAFRLANYACVGLLPAGLFCQNGFALAAGTVFLARKISAIAIGYLAYPAACRRLSQNLSALKQLENDGYVVKKIQIHKSSVRYDAVMIGHKRTIDNGKWTLHALGNAMSMEMVYDRHPRKNYQQNSNTLLINGPSAGQSGGWPTQNQLGAGYEAGLQLLETTVKASHIAMDCLTFGGGMMAEAVRQHDFSYGKTNGIQYLFVVDRSFSRLSDVAAALTSSVAKPILWFAGLELDGIAAANKLSKLGIGQITVQHKSQSNLGSDGVIPDQASLAHRLREEALDCFLPQRLYLESNHIDHYGPLPRLIEKQLDFELNKFFNNNQFHNWFRYLFFFNQPTSKFGSEMNSV